MLSTIMHHIIHSRTLMQLEWQVPLAMLPYGVTAAPCCCPPLRRRSVAALQVRGDDVFFAATGVSDGDLLRGVRYYSGGASTNSLVMRCKSGTGAAAAAAAAAHLALPMLL
jgi:hypothetical protein